MRKINLSRLGSNLFFALALVESHIMVGVLAYGYRDMECQIAHAGASAPAIVALIPGLPMLAGIVVALGMSFALRFCTGKNSEKRHLSEVKQE